MSGLLAAPEIHTKITQDRKAENHAAPRENHAISIYAGQKLTNELTQTHAPPIPETHVSHHPL